MIPSCKFHSPRSSEALSRLHSILHVLPLHHNIHPTQKQRSKHQISLQQMLPGTPVTLAVCLLKYWLKWYMEGPWLFLFLPYWYQNIASDICYLHVIKILVPWEVTRPESTLVPMYVSELWLLTTCGYASFFFVSPVERKTLNPLASWSSWRKAVPPWTATNNEKGHQRNTSPSVRQLTFSLGQ